MKRIIIVGLSALLLQGCVAFYVPPVWDASDEIHDADQVVEGVTTKTKILELLGEPHEMDGRSFTYAGYTSYGAAMIIVFIGGQGDGAAGLIQEEEWWIYLSFDQSDFVETFATSRSPWVDPENRAELKIKADRGNAEAKYQLGKRTSISDDLEAERLKWICSSANDGYPTARYRMGRYFETLPEPDYLEAFLWQSLAAKGGLPAASAAQRRLKKLAPPEAIQDAEIMVASWRSDQSYCDRLVSDVGREEAIARSKREAEAAEDQYHWGQHFYEKSFALEGERRESAMQEAWYWTCLSAHHGQARGQYLLGFWFSQEKSSHRVAPRDEIEAYGWYSRAATQGLSIAQTAKSSASEDMTPAMLTKAKHMMETWRPDPSSCEKRKISEKICNIHEIDRARIRNYITKKLSQSFVKPEILSIEVKHIDQYKVKAQVFFQRSAEHFNIKIPRTRYFDLKICDFLKAS